MNEKTEFFATTSLAMEDLLCEELRALGAEDLRVTRAGVSFKGKLEVGYKACLWSRLANRILMPLATYDAPHAEALYEGAKKIYWGDHLTPKQTLAVDFSSSQSAITHTHFGALKVKDAIVDAQRLKFGERSSVNAARPDVRVNVYVLKDKATVSLDLSGDSLHKRGYREDGGDAPLKENLAAGLLMQAEWHKKDASFSFLDPMCGSGTLPIEAGMIAARMAPGIHRHYFGFLGWQGHVPKLWTRLQNEAKEGEIQDPKKLPKIIGYDQDFRAVRVALANLKNAGLDKRVHIEKRDLSQVESISEQGVLIVNPPFGERLGETEALIPLYKELGDTFKKKFKGWNAYVFTGNSELSKRVGLKAASKTPFWHGPIECRLLGYDLY